METVLVADEPWENVDNVSWPVAEGPTVIHLGDRYYMFYSANDFRHPEYAVGYAVSDNILGPWEKADENPILSVHNTNWPGSGHGDLFVGGDGNYHYVFHTHFSDGEVLPRRTAKVPVVFNDIGDGLFQPHFDGANIVFFKAVQQED